MHFTPVINHVWDLRYQLRPICNCWQLCRICPGVTPWEPMLEFDTTENIFRDKLLKNPLNIQQQVKQNNGRYPDGTARVEPDPDFIAHYEI